VAVKDIFDLKGVRTAASNKAYMDFFPPSIENADSVQGLIDLGAIVVGKTKCTSFADREYPPSDWIDYHCPYNPRGDGYLVPEGSSTGSAAAVAAYEWLDIGLGTDSETELNVTPALYTR
jgi:Asp-tRNA(Asn)/Glu-tRNA(Gln) amidotransferase A subunit family amidase